MTHARHTHLCNLPAYERGQRVAEQGLLVTNPHQPGTDAYEAWALGYTAGCDYLDQASGRADEDYLHDEALNYEPR